MFDLNGICRAHHSIALGLDLPQGRGHAFKRRTRVGAQACDVTTTLGASPFCFRSSPFAAIPRASSFVLTRSKPRSLCKFFDLLPKLDQHAHKLPQTTIVHGFSAKRSDLKNGTIRTKGPGRLIILLLRSSEPG